jgi:hypothetical protein
MDAFVHRLQSGGFEERLDVGAAGCSGDSEFWNRILHTGGVCRYEPGAVIYHFHRRTVEGLRAQIRAYMRGHIAALLVQYERTGERGNLRRIYRSLPGWYLSQGLRRLAGPPYGVQLSLARRGARMP